MITQNPLLFLSVLLCGMPLAVGLGIWMYHQTIGYRQKRRFQARLETGKDSYRQAFKDVYSLTAESAHKVISQNPMYRAMPAILVGSLGFVLIYYFAPEQYQLIAFIIWALSAAIGSFQHASAWERQKMAHKYLDMSEDSADT